MLAIMLLIEGTGESKTTHLKCFKCLCAPMVMALDRRPNYYGIRGIAYNWFKSYLCNRCQCLDDCTSQYHRVQFLGHYYFYYILMIFVMPLYWSSWFCLQTIQTFSWQLKLITEWFRVKKLSINVIRPISFCSPALLKKLQFSHSC